MANADPLPDKEHELIERMKSFAEFLRSQPGLMNVFVLRDEVSGVMVGLSIWRDKQSFERGMKATNGQPPKTALTREPPKMRWFTEL